MAGPLPIEIRRANLNDPADQAAVVELIDVLAVDPGGGGQPLVPEVRRALPAALREEITGRYFLAFHQNEAVGAAICFPGFSTFAAKPLLNIHDLSVKPKFRSQGVGRALLEAIEKDARQHSFCKLTLEVRADNAVALGLYESFGFDQGDTKLRFLAKPLTGP